MAAPDDAQRVLTAVRLGWSLAEMRGRNRPGGPAGETSPMPDHIDHALPLRIERSPTELRIEMQSVVAALAKDMQVDQSDHGSSYGAALDDQAQLLDHMRAPAAAQALRDALGLLQRPVPRQHGQANANAGAARALVILQAGRAEQQVVVARLQHAVTAAQQALEQGRQVLVQASGEPARSTAQAAQASAEATLRRAQTASSGEANGLAALDDVVASVDQAIRAGPQAAGQASIEAIVKGQQKIANAANGPWEDLAELIWQFDAHVQDTLTTVSETQAIGYQLGRGLAETYWALDPHETIGSSSWGFLLGAGRCSELSRLVGRLSAYMAEYTPAAVAGSVEVWREVVSAPAWLGNPVTSDQALYHQIRRWYELIILGQDPTTLIKPGAIMKDYRTLGRAFVQFWPQLVALVVGLGFLGTLLVLLSVGGGPWQKTVSGILAAAGLTVAGVTGTLKNSAQALLTRLRQDAYTDLVAIAVQTAPPPPRRSAVRKAVGGRRLTPATPN
jgi:hypothetical protein